ncbi:hypothetical protein IAQ61_000137 [Plenodomus lingam]|uniref:uncharacterized protein n=1 Tax=Leptosphaeria maculans TaxID=5022 RepID=UPI003323A30A|nr:hypothetical protein IAQ61_000137 [Plenodomus lingam]
MSCCTQCISLRTAAIKLLRMCTTLRTACDLYVVVDGDVDYEKKIQRKGEAYAGPGPTIFRSAPSSSSTPMKAVGNGFAASTPKSKRV